MAEPGQREMAQPRVAPGLHRISPGSEALRGPAAGGETMILILSARASARASARGTAALSAQHLQGAALHHELSVSGRLTAPAW